MRLWLIPFILLGFPVLEVFVAIRVADIIGWWLLAWMLLSAVAGGMLIPEEKKAGFVRLFSSLQSGQPLSYAMLESLRTLFAGVLLIFPGVVSDLLAVLLLLLPRPKAQTADARPMEEVIIEGEWRHEEERKLPSGGSASDRSHPDR